MLSYEEIIQKTISLEEAGRRFSPSFRHTNRMVFTNGCFDLLHRGHVYYLSRARELGDLLVVGLNSDSSVTLLKGPGRPVNNLNARAEVLGALAFVDYIIPFEEETPLNLITRLEPDILVKGGDYKLEDIVGYREVIARGGRVETIPLLEGYSSSAIIGNNKQ
ncbi:MAG: D-glycero-beta-D-manno-heptose 1-phosphate adenylyltransferase [Bacteroidales bacterium]|nr:D-glycero-beta-D-manno-heptose 1-phosphate adenylyltransferase [Bacteroidales bacterium]